MQMVAIPLVELYDNGSNGLVALVQQLVK
jgi:hypothetical protein